MKLWDFISLAVMTVAASAAMLAVPYINIQPLIQRFNLIGYTQPPEIVQLADQAKMTPNAREIFYETRPQIDDNRTTFEQHCQSPISGKVIELGCFTPDHRIYILKISDPNLSEEMVVVGAHEMLHAVYDNLSDLQRSSIDNMVDGQFKTLNNAELNKEASSYRLTEPGQKDNELHSLLGTEYYPLNSQMEQYYSQYFTDRKAVTSQYQAFNQVFLTIQDKLDYLESTIKSYRAQMALNLRSGNIVSYNLLVPVINSLINQYNQTADKFNQLSRSLAGAEQTVGSQ